MSGALSQITTLAAEGRLYEARQQVEALRKQTHPVWGLEEHAKKVDEKVRSVEQELARADQLLEQGHARRALRHYKAVEQRASDWPGVQDKRAEAEERVHRAADCLRQAQTLHADGKPDDALVSAKQAWDDDDSEEARQLYSMLSAEAQAQRNQSRITTIALIATAVVALLALGGVGYMFVSSERALELREKRRELRSKVDGQIGKGENLVDEEKYEQAKSQFQQALATIEKSRFSLPERERQISALLDSPAIEKGTAGLVPFEGKWVEPDKRQRIRSRRDKLKSNVEALRGAVDRYLAGRIDGVEPPDSPSRRDSLLELESRANAILSRIAAGQYEQARQKMDRLSPEADRLLADTGLVKYDGAWMSEAERHRRRMRAKGLVRYEGEWITPEQKKRREMKAKGLVQYNGEWVTPEERKRRRMKAKGLVRYNGEWMSPEEKKAAEHRAKGHVKYAGEWMPKAEAERRREQREQRLAREAYRMSQQFVKEQLKAPATAQFPAFLSQHVIVKMDEEGKFLVIAHVDSKNPLGTMLRTEYMTTVWPVDDEAGQWRTDGVLFPNQ